MGAKVVGHILAGIVALVFLFAGASKLMSWAPQPQNFELWGLPDWMMYGTGLAELVGAVLLVIPLTRVIGAGVLVGIMVGALGVHVLNGEFSSLYGPVVLAALATTVGGLQIPKLREA